MRNDLHSAESKVLLPLINTFIVSHPDVFIYTHTVQRISETQEFLLHKMLFQGDMFRLPLSRLQAPLKYRSKVNNDHSAFWDPKRLH